MDTCPTESFRKRLRSTAREKNQSDLGWVESTHQGRGAWLRLAVGKEQGRGGQGACGTAWGSSAQGRGLCAGHLQRTAELSIGGYHILSHKRKEE